MQSPKLAGKKLVLAPVGRAGSGFLGGMLNLLPSARVAHIGFTAIHARHLGRIFLQGA
jgi:uracil phosphoribosyltransferase